MNKKNIPAIIMLIAGAIASICGIIYRFTFLNTLKITFIVLIIFYIIGLIAGKIIYKINKDANDSYIEKEREKMKEESMLESEENEETDGNEQETANEDKID